MHIKIYNGYWNLERLEAFFTDAFSNSCIKVYTVTRKNGVLTVKFFNVELQYRIDQSRQENQVSLVSKADDEAKPYADWLAYFFNRVELYASNPEVLDSLMQSCKYRLAHINFINSLRNMESLGPVILEFPTEEEDEDGRQVPFKMKELALDGDESIIRLL